MSPIPIGATFVDESLNQLHFRDSEGLEEKQLTRAQKKYAKKKQKKKEKHVTEVAFEIEEVTDSLEQVAITPTKPENDTATTVRGNSTPSKATQSSTSQAKLQSTDLNSHEVPDKDVTRRIRAVRKKLKQIEDLESRIASGEIQKPDNDQLNKIAKKEEFLEELRELTDKEY